MDRLDLASICTLLKDQGCFQVEMHYLNGTFTDIFFIGAWDPKLSEAIGHKEFQKLKDYFYDLVEEILNNESWDWNQDGHSGHFYLDIPDGTYSINHVEEIVTEERSYFEGDLKKIANEES